jgi:hypothetical protein
MTMKTAAAKDKADEIINGCPKKHRAFVRAVYSRASRLFPQDEVFQILGAASVLCEEYGSAFREWTMEKYGDHSATGKWLAYGEDEKQALKEQRVKKAVPRLPGSKKSAWDEVYRSACED